MEDAPFELLRFRHCRDLGGNTISISVGRRNGKPAVFFPPTPCPPCKTPDGTDDFRDQERLFINLNPVERGTWRKLLATQSIASIAKEEGVSRAAIYARIQGNGKGQGGMIAKNFWVLLWWRLRQRLFTTQCHD
jgi:hypothetical protein